MNKLSITLLFCIISLICTAQKYEQRADKYYKYYNYEKARKDYIRVWRKDKDNVGLLKKIIDCYMSDNTLREEALPYIEHLLKIKPNNPEAQLQKATALFHAHQFDNASALLTKMATTINNNPELKKQAEALAINITNARQLINDPLDVSFINLGNTINTSRNEVSPYVTNNEHALFYASDKRYNSYAGIYYYNICVSEKEKLDFEKGKTIGSQLNSIYDEMVAGISPDGSKVFAFHNREGTETMGEATYKGNYRFDPLEDFGAPLDAKGSEYGVWMTTQKDTILFSSENESGNTDIYYAIKLPSGQWGEARLLPGTINSMKYNENFPVLSSDGKRLYFSSDNKYSMGGYDIFYSNWDEAKNEWGPAKNIGYPINDTYNNYSISWVDDRFAYVSAIRPGGFGKYDVYKVVFNNTLPYNALVRCDIRLKKDRRYRIPDFSPYITVTDTMDNLIGNYKANSDSADFVMALTSGHYQIQIEHDNIETLQYELYIPDNRFESVADRIRLVVMPKRPEIATK
ncbi:tetratricopeptide repeat protein [Carboxylicivirga marina]|uniref:PD40 domain-containing protein n=1 Tax=Carboxylicivirga marina TaxID=2800988 RepID=A0ABS1HMH8_9BACT|nr:tetratricopeptide repeat protein [Carboxylicivirga marina]MBK3518836.1 PD40 domain-containing protein [Carboxylicivirga marina]